jgi:hypothetical protein
LHAKGVATNPRARPKDRRYVEGSGELQTFKRWSGYVRVNVRKLTSLAMWRQLTLLTGVGLLVASCGTDAGTSTSQPPASETASTPSAAASPHPREGDLTAGNYALSEFPAAITFDIPPFEPPAVWFPCSASAVEQAVCHEPTPNTGVGVTFQIVDNVVAECSDQETAELLDPPVGPSVDELVTAISSLEGYEATAPVDITVSGFQGKEFTLTAVTHGCGATWATADRITGMGAGEINLLRILDVDGVRVVISGAYQPETPDAAVAAVEHVMDSVQIEP